MEAGDTGVVIDIHAHVMTPEAEEIAAPLFTPDKDPFVDFSGPVSDEYNRRHFAELVPMLTDPERRLRDMDRMGVDVQAISVMPPQYFYWAEPEVGAKLTGMVNDRLFEIVDAHPDRFVGLGTLPLQDVDLALGELERVVEELRFRGLEICSNVNGVDFDDPRFVPFFEQITVDYKEGEMKEVEMHDGSHIRLRKTDHDYDPTNKGQALDMLRRCYDSGEFLTGLIYVNEEKPDFLTLLNMVDDPLATLPQERVQPSASDLEKIMKELM